MFTAGYSLSGLEEYWDLRPLGPWLERGLALWQGWDQAWIWLEMQGQKFRVDPCLFMVDPCLFRGILAYLG